ncbi:MAG: translation elongation factor Ts [Lachnospiraceae bacterium]|nr:translation elongation factor Ts [Lachnospiraceae bacterium]
MAFTAQMVKDLREATGCGMMDCKKALTATDGDMDKAVEFLREKGLAAISKKAGRIAAEGVVTTLVSDDHTAGVILEVNSESDFVAKNEKFLTYVSRVAAQALASENTDIDAFLAEPWIDDATLTVSEELSQMIAVIGEKLTIRRFTKIANPGSYVFSYIHGGGRIASLVELATDGTAEQVADCGKELCLQVTSMNPKFTTPKEIGSDFIEHEKEILHAQIMNDPKESQKPEKVIAGIIQGRINKELKEVVLLNQEYIRAENHESVGQYVKNFAKANGITIDVKRSVRFEAGEGLEKRQENFAEEVAKQIAKN